MKKNFFKAVLHGKGNIHVALGEFSMGLARLTEQFLHATGEVPSQVNRTVGHYLHSLVAADGHEVVEIQMEVAVAKLDDLAQGIAVGVLAVWGKPHYLAFVTIFLVADELAQHGVEAAQRMREKDTVKHFNVVSFAARHHGRHEVTGTVIAESCGSLPRRTVVGAGDVSEMVLEMMLLEAQFLRIDLQSSSQKHTHIAHGLPTLTDFDEIQNLCRIGERVLNFLGQVG